MVMHVPLNFNSDFFRFGRFGSDGKFKIISFANGNFVEEFVGPSENCQIPTICRNLELCSSSTGTCSCSPGFIGDSKNNNGCVLPPDSSLSLSSPCGNVHGGRVDYLTLMNGIDYFSNNFMEPTAHGVDLKFCQDLCSGNCSCLGVFYEHSSSSCFLIWNQIGSVISAANRSRVGT